MRVIMIYLIDSTELLEESFGTAEQGIIIGTQYQEGHIPLTSIRLQQKLLPEGKSKRRQRQKISIVSQ